MAIGASLSATAPQEALLRARQRAVHVPDLLVDARRIANNVVTGWHGRRKRGVGENFWQFRPYTQGETLARIDWRRSARDDHTFVRDREWEAAHTVWLWADRSPSMLFGSRLAPVSKEHRGMVLALAMAELLSRSGERIAWPSVMDPVSARSGAERLAVALTHMASGTNGPPDLSRMKAHSDVVLIGDFLDPVDETLARMRVLAQRGIRGHVVEVYDPAEDIFPYAGQTEFHDPETGRRLRAGRAEAIREEYQSLYQARRMALGEALRRLGWSFVPHRTDHPASQALIALHLHMSSGR